MNGAGENESIPSRYAMAIRASPRRPARSAMTVADDDARVAAALRAPRSDRRSWRPLRAAAAYSAIVFLFGFALGAMRVLVVAPHIGETAAVLLEVPIILGASWVVCTRCVNRFRISEAATSRILMGAAAFVLLMAVELGMSLTLFHHSLSEHFASYRSLPGAIGLAAQFAFAWFPLLQSRPLAAIRAIHTVIYAVMTAATVCVLYAGLTGSRGSWLWISLGLLAVESVVFVGNGCKCPLSAVAVRYGAVDGPLFDTFLPERFTRHTFRIFAPLIFVGVVLLGIRWSMFGECSRWIWRC